ncbi:MAG: malate/lactate/ureidoglycolate dehydrogenase [Pseudomonadota bacterium]
MRIAADPLAAFVANVFHAAGSTPEEAGIVADHLVEANLMGHDSHGVIRVAKYLEWLARGLVVANRHARVVQESGPILVVDGEFGYGQVIGREAMAMGIERARRHGLAAVAIRNAGHLGRIGAWAEQAVAAGLASYHLVNTSGFGILVAPHGGSDRRLSANPIAAGVPVAGGRPLILDIATSIVAEGKIQVARNEREKLPPGCILDGAGRPSTDPETFYAKPPGAILTVGGHKGFGLSVFCEVLAGALTGGGSSHPDSPTAHRLVNNMLSLLFDPAAFAGAAGFAADLRRLIEWVKASPPLDPHSPVLLPGEIEDRTRAERSARGTPIDATTWTQLVEAAGRVGAAVPAWAKEATP